jgi:hypothetical protein
MTVAVHKELKVKRYSVVHAEDTGQVDLMVADAGDFVKVSDVKAALRTMIKSHRLTPETATRIITNLAL